MLRSYRNPYHHVLGLYPWRRHVCHNAGITALRRKELTVRRLKKLQNLSDLLFVLAGVLLADTVYAGTGHSFFKSMFSNQEAYITYLYNKWVILLLVAAVLEVYTSHRIDHELSKKNIKE